MDISDYLIGILSVCMICSVATKLIHKGMVGSIIRLISGIVVAMCLLSPLIRIRLDDISSYIEGIQVDGEMIAVEGENASREAMAEIITEQTTAYILDRADALGLCLTVSVQLAEDGMPAPTGVVIRGAASAYARAQMNAHITEGLGIDTEEIQWTH